jgi:hypothetical protein
MTEKHVTYARWRLTSLVTAWRTGIAKAFERQYADQLHRRHRSAPCSLVWKRCGHAFIATARMTGSAVCWGARLRPNIVEAALVINLLQAPVCVFRSKLKGVFGLPAVHRPRRPEPV